MAELVTISFVSATLALPKPRTQVAPTSRHKGHRIMERDEGSGVIDLQVLLGGGATRSSTAPNEAGSQPRPAPVCDPLATVPNDLYLLVSRDHSLFPSAPSALETTLEARPSRRRRFALATVAIALLAFATAIGVSQTPASTVGTTTLTKGTVPREMRPAAAATHVSANATTPPAVAKERRSKSLAGSSRPSPVRIPAAGAILDLDEEPAPNPATEPAPAEAAPEPEAEPVVAPAKLSLDDAIDNAVADRKEATRDKAAAFVGPNRPALGAVTSAIRSVLPEARKCLGPHDSVRNGRIVFGADGSVDRVQLAGSSQEDDCIRDALKKAKLAPFNEATFSTPVTVRP